MKKCIKRIKLNSKMAFLFVILSLVIVMLLIFFMTSFNFKEYSSDTEVFSINGEPVSKAEFLSVMSTLKGSVYSSIVQKYGGGDSAKFWTTSFNGEVPVETLKRQTLEKLKRIKAEQLLFKKYGIADDISYSGFLKALKDENARREKALEKKEPIFGPVKYDEKVYYDYLQEASAEKLKTKLLKTDLSSSDEEIEKFYNENKAELFKEPDEMKVEMISISYLDQSGNPSSDLKAKAGDTIPKMMENIKQGSTFEDTAKTYTKESGLKIECKQQTIIESLDRANAGIASELNRLQKGQLSDMIEDDNSLNIVRVIEVTPTGFKPLGDVKSQIISAIADKKYQGMVDKLLNEAKLVINPKVYKSISV